MNISFLGIASSDKRAIISSIIFNILAKFFLFLLTIIIARQFGTNLETDIYFFIYSGILLLAGSINVVDIAVIIPESMRLRESNGMSVAIHFLNYFLLIYVILGFFIVFIVYMVGPPLFASISKFSENDINSYNHYFIWGSLLFFFQLLINYFNSILISQKYFTAPLIISCLNSCIVIVGIILFAKKYYLLSVFVSGFVASIISIISLVYILKNKLGWFFLPFTKPNIRPKIWGKLLYAEAGQLTTLIGSYFPLFLMSGYSGGTLSAMNYGKNIADIPNTLLVAQIANLCGVKMNEHAAKNNATKLNNTFLLYSKLLVFFLVPISSFIFVFSQSLVVFFYKNSNFSLDDLAKSAKYLQLFGITIFTVGINAIVSRVFVANQIIKETLFYKIFMCGLLIFAIWICTKYLGALGYPYGLVFFNFFNFFSMFFLCKKFVSFINYAHLLKYSMKIILIYMFITAILFYAFNTYDTKAIYKLLLGSVVYLAVFYLLTKYKEIKILWK